ncbi:MULTISPECIES: class I SAM-dependent methyltransferase [Paraburkholderia]|uniref:Class I SAM-dependent methyltransferase n=1 Tax=Paraburkholderia podalyriae TaxID=1938811 RepID=A0ABR7PGH5_9BURK|nr:class I SAM-dependent methyltransferase [Paraburkholderia podalyriae]MBC8745375.1 class I SAM-dependent methyltransferase [Paraburkholderia podalyriae]
MNNRLATPTTEPELSDLIRWKTGAWQDPGMVNWYSGRMVQSESTNSLKNAVEVGTIKRFVRGPEIVDIGVGTGRAALPLVADGYRLTGIDSSQAMLDETRRLAAGAPITLKVGDVASLPCGDNEFDCAVALNVLVHFPNWRESLLEWKRVVRPEGRLIFDIHSRDHTTAAYGVDHAKWPEPLKLTENNGDFAYYMSRASVDELVDFANSAGLRLVAAVPYGAFLGGGNINWLSYAELDATQRFKRALSWFARDNKLFDLGLFLEESLIAHLTPRVTGRMFVVFDNCPDPEANARFAADVAARDAALDKRDFAALLPWLPLTPNEYATGLERLLQPLRSRHFFFLLFKTLTARQPDFNFGGVIPPGAFEQFLAWIEQERIDQRASEIARGWAADAPFRFKDGVDVTVGVEYNLVKALLEKHFGMFTGGRQ